MQQSKRKIIKTRAGELGHLDCRCLGKDQIVGSKSRRCLVAMLDARARLAWAEAADDLKRLSVMFAALKSLNLLNAENGIRFEAMLTDNGAEAASRGNLAGHPVEPRSALFFRNRLIVEWSGTASVSLSSAKRRNDSRSWSASSMPTSEASCDCWRTMILTIVIGG